MEFDLYGEVLKILTKENLLIMLSFACLLLIIWNLYLRNEHYKLGIDLQKALVRVLSLEELINKRIKK